MASLSLLGFAFYMLVMTGAFAVRSAAGFGAVLIAMPMLAFHPAGIDGADVNHLDTPSKPRLAPGRLGAFHDRGALFGDRHRAWLYFINMLDEEALRRGLGVFLILYSLYALATAGKSPVLPSRWRRALAAGTGVIGGLLGTLFGAGVGPIYVIYFNTLRLEREVFRVTMSTVVLLGGAARIAGYARLGFYEGSSVALIAIGLPLVVIGSWLGDRVIRRVDPAKFGWLVGGLIFLSGVALLVK